MVEEGFLMASMGQEDEEANCSMWLSKGGYSGNLMLW
jgi:hypothetical protein